MVKCPQSLLIILILSMATSLSAYEQGSYFIFDIQPEADDELATAGRTIVSPEVFAASKTNKPEIKPEENTAAENSGFGLDYGSFAVDPPKPFSSDLDLINGNSSANEDADMQTETFGLSESDPLIFLSD